MPDDLTRKRPEDVKRINVHEPWELAYWTKTLGVTREALISAVKAVGTSTDAVKAYLAKAR